MPWNSDEASLAMTENPTRPSSPLVSVGVPVYDGEGRIARALDSLIAQDYANIEIVISDNGSTDGTESICRQYVANDPRIKYFRADVNHGAPWNFNRVFELASGEYFMWAADDDSRDTALVRSCVAMLEKNPAAVLCAPQTEMFIEGRDQGVCIATLDSFGTGMPLIRRYHETLYRFPACALYGVYRSSAMRKTLMWAPSIATDLAFIQELSLYGDIIQVPHVMFAYHGRQSWNTIHQDYRFFVGGASKPRWYLPFAVLFANHWRRLARAPLSAPMKLRLRSILIVNLVRHIIRRATLKILRFACPAPLKERVATALYWRWMYNPNLQISDPSYLYERVIRPTLGW